MSVRIMLPPPPLAECITGGEYHADGGPRAAVALTPSGRAIEAILPSSGSETRSAQGVRQKDTQNLHLKG